jgi:hypothetical protein
LDRVSNSSAFVYAETFRMVPQFSFDRKNFPQISGEFLSNGEVSVSYQELGSVSTNRLQILAPRFDSGRGLQI